MLSDGLQSRSDEPPARWPGHSAPAAGWRLRACWRCGGDVMLYYREPSCLQCGANERTSVGREPDPRPPLPLIIGEVMLLVEGEP